MDQRPPQHPFSRNTASPYGRSPFPPSANPAPFPPPSSHPPSATPSFPEHQHHQRRPSDPPYYNQQRSYGSDGPPLGGPGHSRHQSASSIGGRGMPPPSSPQQGSQHHSYGGSAPLRGAPVSVGAPNAFPSSRDLPSLPPLSQRGQNNGSSMSISSMLGGPSANAREPTTYGSPVVTTTPAPNFSSTVHVSPRMSASSDYGPFRRPQTPEHQRTYETRDHRANSAGSPPGVGSYSTPEGRSRFGTPQNYPRPGPIAEERPGPIRVQNPNSAIPPPRPSSQPNAFNPPGTRVHESPRNPPHHESIFGRRDNNPRATEPRFGERDRERELSSRQSEAQLDRLSEARMAEQRDRELQARLSERRVPERERAEPVYTIPPYEKTNPNYDYAMREMRDRERERERDRDREIMMQREREREMREREIRDRELREREIREREMRDREFRDRELREREQRERALNDPPNNPPHQDYAHQLPQRNPNASYNRISDRDQPPAWARAGYEPPRPAYEPLSPERMPQPSQQPQPQPQPASAYNYPSTTAPSYGGPPVYAPNEPRHSAASQSSNLSSQRAAAQFEVSRLENERIERDLQERERQRSGQIQQQHQQSLHGYQPYESPRRREPDNPPPMQQSRSFLGVQEFNRKGRLSPLPQAVQGVQGQMGGPGGEPGIKSEFGRIFPGLGSGVGGSRNGVPSPSPVTAGPQSLPFSNSGQNRRDDLESSAGQDSPLESSGHKIARSSSRGGGNPRRRKLKEEDSRDDESTGRNTPSARGKRAKTHHHHHHHHHHAPRVEAADQSSPSQSNQTPFKSAKGTAIPSPPGTESKPLGVHHHHVPVARAHSHHHHVSVPKPVAQTNPIIPLAPPVIMSNHELLNSIKNKSRLHLGHAYYEPTLRPGKAKRSGLSNRGFASTPNPLPRFEGRENCTFTVKVPRIHLDETSRKEITARKALWGTDVYTDDSDVVAACIHQGWFQGAFSDDVLLDVLVGTTCENAPLNKVITSPPATGPSLVPENHDLHITILILPSLIRYASNIRFGVKSKEWGDKSHGYQTVNDGVSFMIQSIKWVSGVDGQEAKSGSGRKRIYQLSAEDPEDIENRHLEDEYPGYHAGSGLIQESFVRGDGAGGSSSNILRDLDMRGIGTKNWWQQPLARAKAVNVEKKVEEAPAAVAEKEIQSPAISVAKPESKAAPETPSAPIVEAEKAIEKVAIPEPLPEPEPAQADKSVVERVTERMIQNANTANNTYTDKETGA